MVYSNNFNQVRIGVRNGVVTQVVNAVDADATAFIAAAGITNLTQAAAINTLVNDLKTYGLWTKMKALYPMVGGTATSHKFNLKDPRDLDSAYRLSFSGGWVHTTTGAKPNGTTGYANTFIAPNAMNQNSIHVSFYSRTDIDELKVDISAGSGSSFVEIISRYSNRFYLYMNTAQGEVNINNSSTGFFIGNRITSSTLSFFKNDLKMANGNRGSNPPSNYSFYLAAENNTGVSTYYSSKEQAFASIGDGLTDGEAANFYNAVQKFQTTLGRQIGSPIVSDSDAQAFLNAAGITNLGQATAVNTLVTDLKAAGVWTKMKAVYPFVGGTATTHKFNLKDPRDLDVAYRLVFNGGWTHNSSGALPNGTTGYADTKLTPSTTLSQNNIHISYYSRTNNISGGVDFGSQNSGTTNQLQVILRDTDGTTFFRINRSAGTSGSNMTISDSRLFYLLNRTSSSQEILFTNTTKNTFNYNSTGLAGYPLFLGALNNIGSPLYYGTKETAFASIGDGLTDAESTAFYTAVQKYQTTLGRQIGTPVLESGQTAGLLDTYSSAAAAYSLRKLRTGYYGFAIRVRRSSDNLEQDIAFKSDGTLDTASLLAFVGSGNGFVTTWYDQSSNGYNMLQTTSTAQPQIVSSGNIILENGKPTVSFTSNSKKLQTINLPLSFYDCSLSYVSRNISRTAYACGIFGYGNNGQYSGTRYLGTSFGANTLTFIYFGADVATNLSGAGDTKLALYSLNYQSNTVNIYKDNSTYNSSVSLSNTSTAKFAINDIADRGEMATINFSEGIFYTNGQSSNLSAIRSNQNSYYSIY